MAQFRSSAVPAANIMTGIAGLVDVVADPLGTVARLRLVIEAFLLKQRWRERKPTDPLERFIVLCWRRTGSNWLCGVLHGHPPIMHNELFNESDITPTIARILWTGNGPTSSGTPTRADF